MKKIISQGVLFLVIIVLCFVLSPIAGCKSTTPRQLNVHVWEGYLPESVVVLFEQETGIKLNIVFRLYF